MEKLRVGLIGCGQIAQDRHIPTFLKAKKKVNLVAVCDINSELANLTAKKFKIPMSYSKVEEMFSKETLDIIDICTPPRTHASLALEAIKRGIHILLEKPMATSVSDCDQIIEATKKYNTKLSIVHNNLFNLGFLKFKSIAEKGYIGEIIGLRIYWTTPPSEMLIHENHWAHNLPGGLIGETGPHLVYLSLAFLNKISDVSIKPISITNLPWASFDNYIIQLEGNGKFSSIILSYTNSAHVAWIDLLGTEGVLHLDLISRVITINKCSKLAALQILSSNTKQIIQTIKGVFQTGIKFAQGKDGAGKGHELVINEFIKCVAKNSPLPVSPEEGRETIRTMELIVSKLNELKNT
jgi:predicted dehydrogenase